MNHPKDQNAPSPLSPAPSSIGLRVALAVNAIVIVCGSALIAQDYFREWEHRLADKRYALQEQAMIIYQAIMLLPQNTSSEQQKLINAVCSRKTEVDSPGHHIVVDIDGTLHQSQTCQCDSLDHLATIRTAARANTLNSDSDLLVGGYNEGVLSVYVAEQMSAVRRDVRRQAWLRTLAIGAFGVTLALAVNLAIHRLVQRPLTRLVASINEIAAGRYQQRVESYEGAELVQVATAVNSMSAALAHAAAHRQATIDRARRVQENLLPQLTSTTANQMAFFHRAAEDVAGDYLDLFATTRGTIVLCVADVVGHGIASAMIAAMLKVLTLRAAEDFTEPADILADINRRLIETGLPEAFATMFLAEWRPSTQTLHHVNAGHEPALLVSLATKLALLDSSGPMLGVNPFDTWEAKSIQLSPGDMVACWTDGVTEACNTSDAVLGRDRLISVIRLHPMTDPQDVVDLVERVLYDHVADAPPTDDRSMLAVRFIEKPDCDRNCPNSGI